MKTIRWWQWIIVCLFVPIISFELYCRWPSSSQLPLPDVAPTTTDLLLLFHGTNGSQDSDWLRLADTLNQGASENTAAQVENVIWSPWSDNQFRASAHAESIAKKLGEDLANKDQLQRLHLFASSAGSYLLEPLCEAIREARGDGPTIVMTYLDPIGIKGSLDFTYGYRNYGQCADYAEVYLNTDDAVPGTNKPVEQAYTIDITALKEAEGFSGNGHVWPVVFYSEQLALSGGVPKFSDHDRLPRGSVSTE